MPYIKIEYDKVFTDFPRIVEEIGKWQQDFLGKPSAIHRGENFVLKEVARRFEVRCSRSELTNAYGADKKGVFHLSEHLFEIVKVIIDTVKAEDDLRTFVQSLAGGSSRIECQELLCPGLLAALANHAGDRDDVATLLHRLSSLDDACKN